MLKLLLPHKEKMIKSIYRTRLLTIILYGIAFVVLYYAIALAPSVIITQAQRTVLQDQIEIVKDPVLNKDKVLMREKIAQAALTIDLLDENTYEITNIIAAITKKQLNTIAISSMEFNGKRDKKNNVIGAEVSVQGIAENRESLVQFVDALKKESQFQLVNLPVSSFTKEFDVPFSIIITMNSLEAIKESNNSK